MIAEIAHDVLIATIVYFVGLLTKKVLREISREPSSMPKQRSEKTKARKQFYCSLLALIVSLSVICSVTWEFAFSWPVILKSIAFITFIFSFILLCGSFDSLYDEESDKAVREREPDE